MEHLCSSFFFSLNRWITIQDHLRFLLGWLWLLWKLIQLIRWIYFVEGMTKRNIWIIIWKFSIFKNCDWFIFESWFRTINKTSYTYRLFMVFYFINWRSFLTKYFISYTLSRSTCSKFYIYFSWSLFIFSYWWKLDLFLAKSSFD